jgi:glycosyltransferase involved in cell wall biosynthesis
MHTKVSLVVPYFEDEEQLSRLLTMGSTKLWDEVIIVDDGSTKELAKEVVERWADDDINIRILRVPINYGFNGHGCRNLGVQQATHDWVFLMDVDMEISEESVKAVYKHIPELTEDQFLGVWARPYPCDSVAWLYVGKNYMDHIDPVEYNTYGIRKETFLKTRGYDEDFRNMHGGSRVFVERLQTFLERKHFDDIIAGAMRPGREVVIQDVEITEYHKDVIRHPPSYMKFDKLLKEISYYRNEHPETWKDKTFVDFEWYEETL